ncbi:hypothetical protein CB1_001026038 [Camelus ferus]|nr:hypothetical protein CB1_001026038 [Camelus ferus]
MGSVSSALARSRNAVVQPGSSPPQPEAPPAAPSARRDLFALSKTRRLGLGRVEAAAGPAAPEAQPVAPSLEGRAKLASPELSLVLKRAERMSQPHLPGLPSPEALRALTYDEDLSSSLCLTPPPLDVRELIFSVLTGGCVFHTLRPCFSQEKPNSSKALPYPFVYGAPGHKEYVELSMPMDK